MNNITLDDEPSESHLDLHQQAQLNEFNHVFAKKVYNSDRAILHYWLRVFRKAPKSQKLARNSLTLLMYAHLREYGYLRSPFTDMNNCTKNLNDVLSAYVGATQMKYIQSPKAMKVTSESSNESKTKVLLPIKSKRFSSSSTLDCLSTTPSKCSSHTTFYPKCDSPATISTKRTRIFSTTSKSSDVSPSDQLLHSMQRELHKEGSASTDGSPGKIRKYFDSTENSSVRGPTTVASVKYMPTRRILNPNSYDQRKKCLSKNIYLADAKNTTSKTQPFLSRRSGISTEIPKAASVQSCSPNNTFDSHSCDRCRKQETDVGSQVKLTDTELELADELNLIFDEVIDKKMNRLTSSETSWNYTYRFGNYDPYIQKKIETMRNSNLPNLNGVKPTEKTSKSKEQQFEEPSPLRNQYGWNRQETGVSIDKKTSDKTVPLQSKILKTAEYKPNIETEREKTCLLCRALNNKNLETSDRTQTDTASIQSKETNFETKICNDLKNYATNYRTETGTATNQKKKVNFDTRNSNDLKNKNNETKDRKTTDTASNQRKNVNYNYKSSNNIHSDTGSDPIKEYTKVVQADVHYESKKCYDLDNQKYKKSDRTLPDTASSQRKQSTKAVQADVHYETSKDLKNTHYEKGERLLQSSNQKRQSSKAIQVDLSYESRKLNDLKNKTNDTASNQKKYTNYESRKNKKYDIYKRIPIDKAAVQRKQATKAVQVSSPISSTTVQTKSSASSKAANSSSEHSKEEDDEEETRALLAQQQILIRLCLRYYTKDGVLRDKPILPRFDLTRSLLILKAFCVYRKLTRSHRFMHPHGHATQRQAETRGHAKEAAAAGAGAATRAKATQVGSGAKCARFPGLGQNSPLM